MNESSIHHPFWAYTTKTSFGFTQTDPLFERNVDTTQKTPHSMHIMLGAHVWPITESTNPKNERNRKVRVGTRRKEASWVLSGNPFKLVFEVLDRAVCTWIFGVVNAFPRNRLPRAPSWRSKLGPGYVSLLAVILYSIKQGHGHLSPSLPWKV